MKPLQLSEIRRILNARAIGAADPSIGSVGTDTRKMQRGCLFVAIRGDKFDGLNFLPQAQANGAAAALVDREPEHPVGIPLLLVPSARAAMGQLAAHVRKSFRGKIIAVAGSNGKTSTKRLIDAALRRNFRGSISPKSFNNDIGVPLTIFPADSEQDYLVLELGTNHPGEIKGLTNICRPDIGVITNCTAEHLEGLRDIAGVRAENATLIDGMSAAGVLIVNGDDQDLLKAVSRFEGTRICFGFLSGNDLIARNISCTDDGTSFDVNGGVGRVFIPMLGKHSATNALAAIAVGRAMEIPDEQIVASLRSAKSPEMRLELTEIGGIRVLNDAYNANPASMQAALETLLALPARGQRIAVLGDMRELGKASEDCHRNIGRLAARKFRPDRLICVGP